MKQIKRFISIILALLMTISSAPLTALADEEEPEIISGHYESPDDDSYSFDWTYYSEMDALYLDGEIIESIPIEDPDTGDYEFYLPIYVEQDGTEYLVERAFNSIVFSNNVKQLGSNCLGYNDGFSFYVGFEKGTQLETIEPEAFFGYNIISIVIPDSVTYIGANSFTECNIKSIKLPSYSENALILDSGIFTDSTIGEMDFNNCNTNAIPSYCFCDATVNKLINIPSSVKTIGNNAFAGAIIKNNIVLPDSLENINQYAFYNSHLKSIEFPSGIKTIGAAAFKNCIVDNASYYSYNTGETSVQSNSFTGSNINVTVIEPESDYDSEQHSVSGSYDGSLGGKPLNWSYNAETDTLYLDGKTIATAKIFTETQLPLVYKSASGKDILWTGDYSHIVFSNNVEELEKDCLGITDWTETDFVTVDFEENSKLEYIGPYAFQKVKVKRLILPDSVYEIDNYAFALSHIEHIRLPHYQGSKEIFLGTGLFQSCKGIEIDFNGMEIEQIPEQMFRTATLNNFSIPSTVKTIDTRAFYGAVINGNLNIPETVESISNRAFYNIKVEGNVNLTKDFEYLENETFSHADINGNIIIADNVSKLSQRMFEGACASKIYIGKSIKYIPESCFEEAEPEEGFEFSNEIQNLVIGENAFSFSTIKSFNISSSIESICESAFYGCNSLTKVTADDNCIIESFSTALFADCENLQSIEIPSSIKVFDTYVLSGCDNLSTIIFKSGSQIQEIGEEAFSNMISLERIDIPASVKNIGIRAFKDCTNLSEINFENGSQLEEIKDYAFSNLTSLESINIPSSVKHIGASAFYNDAALKNVILSDESLLEDIGGSAFSKCTAMKSLSLNVCSHLKTIGAYAFAYDSNLDDITLPEGLTTISKAAFTACASLETVQLPSSLETIEESIFENCTKLESVNIPRKVTQISDKAFSGDAYLNITIPSTVTQIGNLAFYQCLEMTDIPSSVVSIGESAFKESGITKLILPNKDNVSIGKEAFMNCQYLKSVNLYNSSVTFGSSPFRGCSNLISFIFPEYSPAIPDYFLYETKVGGEINIPESATYIGKYAFSKTLITSVGIPENCLTVGNNAFSYCSNLEEVEFSETTSKNKTIQSYAFYKCTALKKANIPYGVQVINEYAFSQSGITSLTLPTSLTTIKNKAFEYTKITELNIPEYVSTIESAAFRYCENLLSVKFSENSKLTLINTNAFYNCSKLRDVEIPKNVKSIGSYAFYKCDIMGITIPSACTVVEGYAFAENPLKSAVILNRDMNFYTYSFFYRNGSYDTTGTVYGYSDSTAQKYANNHSINFLPIDSVEDPENTDFDNLDISHTYGRWENGTWDIIVSSNKTLRIEGSGTLSPELTDSKGDTYSIKDIIEEFNISTLYIGEGVTSVPDNFLYDETGVGVNFVRLPNSLKSIGAHAFDGTSVVAFYNSARASKISSGVYSSYIPQNVTHIGEYAFANTDSLQAEFELPKDITEIPEGLFYRSGVHNVSMYGRVTKIGKRAFADCENMTSLYVPCSVTEIYSDEDFNNNAFGIANGKVNGNLWVLTRSGSVGDTYSKSLGLHTSDYLGVPYREGTFADSSSTLNTSQMEWKYYIEDNSLILSPVASNMTVSTNAAKFYEYQPDSNITSYVGNTYHTGVMNLNPDKVTLDRILEFTCPDFLSLFNPKEIEVYNALRLLGERSFAGCDRIEEIKLPMAFSSAGTYCFSGCTSLKNVRLGYGMAKIEDGLFNECRNLEAVDLGNVVLQNIGEKAFYNCNKLKFVNLKNKTSYNMGTIGDMAFYNCVNLQEINIPDNIKTIGYRAFYNCVQAQQINISGNVESIGKEAFANIFYCEKINLNSEVNSDAITNEREIFPNLGAYTNGIEINIGNGVETLDCKFFDGLKVTTLNLSPTVNNLENKQYFGKLKEITAENNETYSVIDNGLYNKSGDVLVLYPQGLSDVKIAPTAKYISDYALYKTSAKSITLPDSIQAIGKSSFASSETLVGITLSENISEIPENAFKDCVKLRLLNLPETVLAIRESAFEGCTSLVSAVFNASLETIAKNAFKGCVKLEGLAFPENLKIIGYASFMNCSNLKYAYIWNAQIGGNAFANCEKLNIFTPVRTDAYRYAREFDIPYSAYTDEELFYDEWAIKIDALAGYLGYCEEDGHGDIQYLTVYEADCDNDGFIIGVCEYCSEILEEIHIDAYGHNYELTTEIPATETTKGISVYTCSKCHQSYTTYTSPLDEKFETEVHTVSGTVEIAADKNARRGISPAKNASIVIDDNVVAKTDENGDFSFEIETGSYIAHIKYAYGFTRTIYIVVKDRDIKYDTPIPIIGCDFSKDGIINDEDITLFQMIISAKKDDPSYLSFVDLNGDGYINAKDLLYIKAFSGISESEYSYRQIIIN